MKQYNYISKFSCLQGDCPDTCCKGWDMQFDPVREKLYKEEAPELLDAVTMADHGMIMKRDKNTDYCVKFAEDGGCKIHSSKGEKFLGDACHFFPRATRKLGEESIMAGTLSCPEIVRLTLFEEDAFTINEVKEDRLPVSIKDYLPEEGEADGALKVITKLLEFAGDESRTPERKLAMLYSISLTLKRFPASKWPEIIEMAINLGEGKLPAPEASETDTITLFQIMSGIIYATGKKHSTRLAETLSTMQQTIGIYVDWDKLEFTMNPDEHAKGIASLQQREVLVKDKLDPILSRWLQAQLSLASFPYAGFGETIEDRAVIIAARFAIIKLALLCHVTDDGELPDEDTIIRVIQSLARTLDHLADPTFSLTAFEEAGWMKEARLRALLRDK